MKFFKLLTIVVCLGLAGCNLSGLGPQSKVSKTDVVSARKGSPSAEISITSFSGILKDEAEGKPCPQAWDTYDKYWKSRIQYIAKNESKEYYKRVFRDFDAARVRVGLKPIVVPTYEMLHETSD